MLEIVAGIVLGPSVLVTAPTVLRLHRRLASRPLDHPSHPARLAGLGYLIGASTIWKRPTASPATAEFLEEGRKQW